MRFSPTQLQILAGLVEGKTLQAIGEALFLGQPAVSKALRVAEQSAGVRLVERDRRRLRLTPVGAAIGRAAQTAVAGMRDVERLVEHVHQGTGGPLRLAATSTPGNYILPLALGQLLQELPAVDVVLRVALPEEIGGILVNEGYDLGVAPAQPPMEGWEAELLYEDQLTFFVAPGSPLAARGALRWEALRDQTLVGSFAGAFVRRRWAELAERGVLPARRMELYTAEGIKQLVEAGSGVGVLMGAAIWREVRDGRLVPLRLAEDLPLQERFYLQRRRLVRPLPLVETFRACLTRTICQLQAAPEHLGPSGGAL